MMLRAAAILGVALLAAGCAAPYGPGGNPGYAYYGGPGPAYYTGGPQVAYVYEQGYGWGYRDHDRHWHGAPPGYRPDGGRFGPPGGFAGGRPDFRGDGPRAGAERLGNILERGPGRPGPGPGGGFRGPGGPGPESGGFRGPGGPGSAPRPGPGQWPSLPGQGPH